MKSSNIKRRLTTASLVLALLFTTQSFAQSQSMQRNWSIDLMGGIPYTQFTVGSEFLTPTAAFNIRYAANPQFAIRGSFAGGMLEGTGENWFGQNYENQFVRFSLQPEFSIVRSSTVNLALFGGIGILKNDVTVSLENPRGTGNRYAGSPNDDFTSNLSVGSSFRVRLSPRLDFLLQVEENFTTSASMDGYDFVNSRTGDRVNQSGNDRFMTAMAGFTIKFGSNKQRHAMWRKEPSIDEAVKPLAQEIDQLKRKTAQNEKSINEQDKQAEENKTAIADNRQQIKQMKQRDLPRMIDSVEASLKELKKKEEEKQKMMRATGNYYIVTGSYLTMNRAMNHLRQLKEQGHQDARILPPKAQQSKWYRVAFTHGMSRTEANNLLKNKYRALNSEAWLFQYTREPVKGN